MKIQQIFTINAEGEDGNLYAVYITCETMEQAEHITEQLKLQPDEAGVCEFIEAFDTNLH